MVLWLFKCSIIVRDTLDLRYPTSSILYSYDRIWGHFTSKLSCSKWFIRLPNNLCFYRMVLVDEYFYVALLIYAIILTYNYVYVYWYMTLLLKNVTKFKNMYNFTCVKVTCIPALISNFWSIFASPKYFKIKSLSLGFTLVL